MYFDFWDNRPDTPRLSSPMTPREKTFATVIIHLLLVILILVWPEIPWVKEAEARRQQALEAIEQQRLQQQQEAPRFVYIAPRIERKVEPPPRAELSDLDRRAASTVRPPDPKTSMPFSRGNTPEKVDNGAVTGPAIPSAPPEPPAGGGNGEAAREVPPLPESNNGIVLRQPDNSKPQMRGPATGILADAIKNVQKYASQETFENPQGGAATNQQEPWIQFDSKGVEFGPWLRRFRAQIYRNWFIPYAAMTMKGHVVLTFYVHRDGRLTDLRVLKPSAVDAFTNSASNALAASNPTIPLPTEYPDDRVFFTVTFYFNETPR